jgi:hypothetical protein
MARMRFRRPWTFKPSALMYLARLAAYPSGNLTPLRNLQNVIRCAGVNTYLACGILTILPSRTQHNSSLIFISSKSSLAFNVSLVFFSFSNVQRKQSHMFFSMCITSRLWGQQQLSPIWKVPPRRHALID